MDQRITFHFNKMDGKILLAKADGVEVFYVNKENEEWVPIKVGESVKNPLAYEGFMSVVSKKSGGFNFAILHHVLEDGSVAEEFRIDIGDIPIELSIDANRDGIIGTLDERGKDAWVWGKGKPGAIIMVNNDRDISDLKPNSHEKSELVNLILRPTGLEQLPPNVELVLYTLPDLENHFAVHREKSDGTLETILGRTKNGTSINVSAPLSPLGEKFFIEAYDLPNPGFEGLITIELHLRQKNKLPVAIETILVRVAPWIMTPNTLPVAEIFTCVIPDGITENSKFLEGLKAACKELNVPLRLIPYDINQGDRWIQDEMEIGYCESPTHYLPVVFDSPRDRELDVFPEQLLGPDFGHFSIPRTFIESLDSFGNLEVSPPVYVKDQYYPFGRIIFGGRKYGDYESGSRQMMVYLREFLYAQKIQSPIQIFTDWLGVGHVDEIVNFVPATNEKGFKMLIASPMRAKSILERLYSEGHGNVLMFEGLSRLDDNSQAEISIQSLLSNEKFWEENGYFQSCMDINRQILIENLGLTDAEIIQIPVLFHERKNGAKRSMAFFPDMVNHLVIGNASIVPKPYGPMINGIDVFEEAFRHALPERKVYFIDDWYSYHEKLGEVHCGTNVRRKPFSDRKWWEYIPDRGYDVR